MREDELQTPMCSGVAARCLGAQTLALAETAHTDMQARREIYMP